MLSETLLEYELPVVAENGKVYRARARGRPRVDGLWEGWIELESIDGDELLTTPRETTQPNHKDLVYWATGVTPVFLEGALVRARDA
jgi:hypothetical protein